MTQAPHATLKKKGNSSDLPGCCEHSAAGDMLTHDMVTCLDSLKAAVVPESHVISPDTTAPFMKACSPKLNHTGLRPQKLNIKQIEHNKR